MNKELFIESVEKLNINLTNEMLDQLEEYYKILVSENAKYNLTTITDKESVYLKHFYDSLTLSKIIKLDNQSLCDIGTGAGFPGMVLKIAFPNLKVTLVDATEKKCNFLKLVINKLNLKDIEVINARAEIYSKEVREKYDIVTSRAVAPLKHLLEYSIPLVKVDGTYIAMKSDITKELEGISNYENKLKIYNQKILTFKLPVEESTRTLISYTKKEKTNKIYPRRYNEIKKKEI
ncbi:MAG: 16S rRNA (guanine(527)-N(7))-methyltransferase RsmG [Bacilli bacterium]|nr:16S rRNA (guanine(527)-N(7))-methyltransferase RsmG [Bacilli bacterium]